MGIARSIHVVQILPALSGGGVERGTLEVAAELVRRGHRSTVISAGGHMVEALEAAGSRHLTWPVRDKSLKAIPWIWRMRRWLASQDIDILHARSRLPAWISWLAWRGLPPAQRPRFITTCHGAHSVNLYSSIMARGEIVIAVSRFIQQYLLDNYPIIGADRIRLIPRGIDAQAFPFGYQPDPAWRAEWEATYPHLRGRHVITLAGRLTRLKGHTDLIELIRRLNQAGVPASGLIVGGSDPERQKYVDELKASAAQLPAGQIVFTGQRNDIREIYSVSDLILSLSKKPESFGRTVMEALALGRPVLAYDHGGVSEILEAHFPQGKVALNDQEQLLARTQSLLLNPPDIPDSRAFMLSHMLDATVSLYQELAATHPQA